MAYRIGLAGLDALDWAKVKSRLVQFFRVGGEVSSLLNRGEALDEATRLQMESALGYDLKGVHIHQTKQAGELARALGAEAFTVGADIFTAEGKFDTLSAESRGLLAHELTHVIQQTRPRPILRVSHSVRSESRQSPEDEAFLASPGHVEPRQPALQLAPVAPFQSWANSTSAAMEKVAQTTERVVRSEEEYPTQSQAPTVDAEEIAEIVYRLMHEDLSIEKDRVGR